MSQENAEVIRRIYDAVARGDSEAVLALYDAGVEFDLSRVGSWGDLTDQRVHHGHEELRAVFATWAEAWNDVRDQLDEVIDAGDRVISVATGRGRGRVSGAEVERANYAGVWPIRDGRVIRVVWFESRDEALEAVGLSE